MVTTTIDPERRHEAITMALYVSISLLSVMVALPEEISPQEAERPALAIVLTSIGLMLAHTLAFAVSSRLAHGRTLSEVAAVLAAQLAGGLAVTTVAALPILLIDGAAGVRVAEYLLIVFIGATAYSAGRAGAMSRLHSAGYVGIVVSVAVVVLVVKTFTPH